MKFLLNLQKGSFFFLRLQATVPIEFLMGNSMKIPVIWYNMRTAQSEKCTIRNQY